MSFTEPYVFDRNISAGADIYRRDFNSFNFTSRERNTTFEQSTTGGSIRVGVPLTEFMSLVGSYTLNYDEVSLAENLFFTDFDGDLIRGNSPEDVCDPIQAGRFLCDALGNRLSSILGVSVNYNSLNSGIRPTRGRRISVSSEFAGLGGDVRYLRLRGQAQQFWNLFDTGFIFSLSLEGGTIIPLQDRVGEGVDDILLTDRFFLGEPRFRGFDIRGVGPRILTQIYDLDQFNNNVLDDNGDPVLITDRNRIRDDSIGGRNYYLGRAEIEIPLGTGARELGLRPSIFVDVGALWGVERPILQDNPTGLPQVDGDGNPLFISNDTGDTTIDPLDSNGDPNFRLIQFNTAIREVFLGDSPSPRITAGIGVNWNSPFGPFRIDFAQTIRKVEGDDDKTLTFNVGTQF